MRIAQGTIGSSSAATSSAAPARPGCQPRARPIRISGQDGEGDADQQVLGPDQRGEAEEEARAGATWRASAPIARVRRAQRKASTAAGRVKIAGGSLKRAPVEWMKGG